MKATDLKSFNRMARVVVGGIALCIFCLLLLGGAHLWREVFKPPPFYFSQPVYAAQKPRFCPGETVEWKPELIVTRTPTLLVVARTVWSVSDHRTAMPEMEPKYFVWTELETGKPVARPTRLTLPADLKPGPYEIRSAATSFNSDAATYRVPFVVKNCGGTKP